MTDVVSTAAKLFFRKGKRFLGFGEPFAAAEMFQKAVEIDPSFREAWTLLGAALHSAGEFEKAHAVLKAAIAIHPDDLELLKKLGMVELELNHYREATKYLKTYLEKGGSDTDALLALARAAFEIEDCNTVLSVTAKILNDDETNHKAWELRGLCQARKSRYNAAVMSLNMAIDFHPESTDALNAVGDLCYSEGNYERALEFYRSSLAAKWEQPEILFRFGTSLWFAGKWSTAISILDEYTQMAPDDPRGWNNLGVLLREKGEITRAISCYRRALEIDPSFEIAQKNLETAKDKKMAL